MCGIVGYVGRKTRIKDAILSLKKLEYRGYDSSGVAYFEKKKIKTIKQVGPIDNLLAEVANQNSKVCICHTRWATHGKVCTDNAHPQVSFAGNFAVVHNGIIENYQELKTMIGSDKFSSQTDTEVIANLLETCTGDTLERLTEATNRLDGSYALAVMDKQDKYLYVAKQKSPLYAAKTGGGYMVASDICCFDSDFYYVLPDGVIGKLSKNGAEFYQNGQKITLEPTKNNFNFDQVYLGEYSHYMAKEIDETSTVLNNICTRYSSMFSDLFSKDMFKDIKSIYLVGCGTAYHACQMGASWLQNNFRLNAQAHIASELRYSNPLIDQNSLVILVSQSGETADTLAVAELAKERGAKIFAITNVEYSSIAQVADKVFPLCAGPEIGVASTKAYSAMLAVLYILANHTLGAEQLVKNLIDASKKLTIKIDNKIVETVSKAKRVFFIGRADDGISSSEGALKLKEIAYIDACGYYAGELKHGTIALVEPNVVVIAIITNNSLKAKTLNAVEEVQSRGATVIVITDDSTLKGNFTKIVVPTIDSPELKSLVVVVPLQKLAYAVATALSHNPDKPRNLAKSVTVE